MPKKIIKTAFSFFCICTIALLSLCDQVTAGSGKWDIYKRASISSKNHGTLHIEYRPGKGIKILLSMRDKKISFKEKLPLYRVDNGKVHQLDNAPDLATGQNRWIRWRLTNENEISSMELEEILNGKKLYFQYYLPGNIIKEVVFELTGIREAVNEIIR